MTPPRSESGSRGNREAGRRTRAPAEAGFTLVELLIVVMILVLVAALALPYLSSTSDLDVISAARVLTADMQYAQNVSITTQVPVTVTFDVAANIYQLGNASGLLIHPITKAEYTVDFASMSGFDGLDIVSADFGGGGTVTFDALGAADNAGTVTLQAGTQQCLVNVQAVTGKVTVTEPGD